MLSRPRLLKHMSPSSMSAGIAGIFFNECRDPAGLSARCL